KGRRAKADGFTVGFPLCSISRWTYPDVPETEDPREASMDFPDDHSLTFVRDFPTVIAPEYRNRSILNSGPTTLLLRVPESAYPRGADGVLGALSDALHGNGKLVQLAELYPADDSTLLSKEAGA